MPLVRRSSNTLSDHSLTPHLQAERLRAHLQAGTERLNHLQVQGGDGSREALAALMIDLRTSEDEHAILKLRRMIGPIKVTLRSAREQCSLNWRRKPG